MPETNFKKGQVDFVDLQDILNVSKNKLRFVIEFFINQSPGNEPEISEQAGSGMAAIMNDIKNEIEVIIDELDVMKERTAKTNP